MRTLHSLTEPISQLRQKSDDLRAWLSFRVYNSSASGNSLRNETQQGNSPKRNLQQIMSSTRRGEPRKLGKRNKGKKHPPLIWVVAVVSLTSMTGNRFYDQPRLDVGTISPQKITAPSDTTVEDTKTTEEKRKAARTGSVPVLEIDRSLTREITHELQQYLKKVEELRALSGSFPFEQRSILSDFTQRYLLRSEESDWQELLAAVKSDQSAYGESSAAIMSGQADGKKNLSFVQALSELESYRQLSSPQEFNNLIESIQEARYGYAEASRRLKELQVAEPNVPYNKSLLELSDHVWQETRQGIFEASKRILTQGIPPGLPPNIIESAVRMQVSNLVPPDTESLATALLTKVLKPNLTEDKEQTKQRAEQAALAVEPVIVSVQAGDVIVEAGEKITQADFVLLDHFNLSRREINWRGLIAFGGLVTAAVGVFWLVEIRVHPSWRRRDHILILLLTLSTPVLVSLGIPYTSLPAIGLLVGSFYGSSLGITVVSLLTGLVGIGMEVHWVSFLAAAAGGLLGAGVAGRLRSREELALLGVGVGLTEGTVYMILNLILSASAGSIWYTMLQEAVLYGFAGLSWSIVALGSSPYLERLFDLVTPILLAELSNPNRPLLKRLATEAPGTFQHTLFVASLAEAAARELHCNVELVRAGTLYHDIGKMHDPLGFIENQMGGPNKHDEINNPYKSAQIIKKHVSEGLVMARKHQLPKAIRDFIPEHQGKLLISYFYFQAKQKAEGESSPPLLEADFRYDGPIPQSRETGIVMLADACEAALRSLQDVTPETALNMVNKIFKARWQDEQLIDSGLTREDLSIIAEVFVKVWQQCNHKRIAYPKGALNCQSSAK